MEWYNEFNAIEAVLWAFVAIVIPIRVPCVTWQQRCGVTLASCAFVVFGVTDLLEIHKAGSLPLWLWGLKVACGVGILSARYLWLGWNKFSWRDREVRFGLACLLAVGILIYLQRFNESWCSV